MDFISREIARLWRLLEQIQRQLQDVRNRVANLPVRWGGGGGGGSGPIYVDLTEEGSGSDGDKNNPCSWTYTAYRRGTVTNPLGTSLVPVMRRRNGRTLPALIGLGQYEDGEFVLFWCDEVPRTNSCTT